MRFWNREGEFDGDIDIVEETRFRLNWGQKFLGALMLVSLTAFGITTFVTSRQSISQAQILSKVESPASSIIFTQRETLVYVTRLSEWLAGSIDRRTVQIARALLAQRLNVIDADGTQVGNRLDPIFLASLRTSDQLLGAAPSGLLPNSLRSNYLATGKPIIDSILLNSRSLIESYQHAVDTQVRQQVVVRERGARINLGLLVWLIILNLTLFVWVGYTTRNQYRRGRRAIREENRILLQTRAELNLTRESLVQLQSLNEAKNEFISTINHELRTPLTSIIGYIGLIRRKLEKQSPIQEVEPLINTLHRNALGLLDLVEGMLSISHLDATDIGIDFGKIDLVPNIESVLFVLEPSFLERDISIDFSATKDEFIIDGNYGQISQVFMNLISNAIKFSPKGSSIEIILVREVSDTQIPYIDIHIIDQGIGIPAQDIPHLFTRFFRASNVVSEQLPGTGLGLAIVQKIVLLHGGSISVISDIGHGTDFRIRLPEALSSTDALISSRRSSVLQRSMSKMEAATLTDISAIAHEIGGAIGFYTFVEEGRRILEISRELGAQSVLTDSDFNKAQTEIMTLLHSALSRIENEEI
jgi:signal transduction histidine kinase